MWLLKLHKERYERYKATRKYKSKFVVRMCVYICPIVNVICVITVLYMAFASDEFVEEINSYGES